MWKSSWSKSNLWSKPLVQMFETVLTKENNTEGDQESRITKACCQQDQKGKSALFYQQVHLAIFSCHSK